MMWIGHLRASTLQVFGAKRDCSSGRTNGYKSKKHILLVASILAQTDLPKPVLITVYSGIFDNDTSIFDEKTSVFFWRWFSACCEMSEVRLIGIPYRVAVVVQARMGSKRLRGKVLLPIRNKPLLTYLLESLLQCEGITDIIVATSSNACDDAIAAYCGQQHLVCYRGSELNVASRFYDLAVSHDWDAFVRISADSPLLDHRLIDQAMTLFANGPCDLVTNIFPRTFPRGQSIELMRTGAFLESYPSLHSADDLEHVTPFFYRNSGDYTIRNLALEVDASHLHMAVDTPHDMAVAKRVVERMQREHWTYSLKERMEFWTQEQERVGRQAA